MRLPNPRMVAIDFLYGTIAALPIGALYFLVIIPSTLKHAFLLCINGGDGVLYPGLRYKTPSGIVRRTGEYD